MPRNDAARTRSVFDFDVFLSHSSKDKLAVRELAARLKKDGIKVWLDEEQVRPGDSIVLKVEEGLKKSRVLVLVMSEAADDSDWVQIERGTIMFLDPANRQRRLVPLRLDDAPIRDTLKQFAYVDWRKRDAAAYAALLEACRAPVGAKAPTPTADTAPKPTSVQLLGHSFMVDGVAVTADGRRAVSGSLDNTVRVWDLDKGRCTAVLNGHTGQVWRVAFTPDGRRAVSGSDDSTLRVWDLDKGLCTAVLEGHKRAIFGVSVTPDGRRAVSGSGDNTLRVWDLDKSLCTAVLDGHSKANRLSAPRSSLWLSSASGCN